MQITMDQRLTLGVMLVFCALATNTVRAGDDCKLDKLSKCFSSLQYLTLNMLDGIRNAVGNSYYCQVLHEKGDCPNNKAFKDCKEKHPKVSKLASSLHDYLSPFCKDDAKALMEFYPCFMDHRTAFEKCWPQQKTDRRNETEHVDAICMEMKSMQCLGNLSKEKCKDGKEISRTVEKSVNNLKSDLKCGAASLIFDFRILTVAIFSLLLMRTKYN